MDPVNVTFYNFSKKNNSTKQPTGGTALSCEIKESCSILAPVLIISQAALNVSWNYCHIPTWSRYYFINNISWINGRWEINCTVDALASWKTQIGNHTEYVLREDSSLNNGIYNSMISDAEYPTTTAFTIDQRSMTTTYPFAAAYSHGIAAGCFILGVINNNATDSVGAVTYYALTAAQLGVLKNILMSDYNMQNMGIIDGQGAPLVTDMSPEILKTMYNPFQYIVSCMWFPFSVSDIDETTPVTTIPLGWWEYPGFAGSPVHKVAAQIVSFGQNGTIVPHPMAATRGVYLNYAPFTRRYLIGVCGCIPLDTSLFGVNDRIHVTYDIDLITGSCRFEIGCYNSTDDPATIIQIARREFLIGVPIQLAQVGTDYLGIATAAIDTAAGVAGNLFTLNFGGAASAAAHGIYDTVKTSMPQMETGGSNGSFLCMDDGLLIVSQFFIPVDEDITHRGRPLCANIQLNQLNGFILCAEGETDIPCTAEEKQIIAGFLTGGFFME